MNLIGLSKDELTIDITETSKMKICLTAREYIEAEITTTHLFKARAKVQVVVLNNFGKSTEFSNDVKDIVSENDNWYINTNIRKSMLMCYSHLFFSANKLALQLNFTISVRVSFHNIVKESDFFAIYPETTASTSAVLGSGVSSVIPENEPHETDKNSLKSSCTISKAVQDMFSEGYLSDFNLKVGEKVFPVHKTILGMRSKVFKAMFNSEMKEMQDNCVVIKDMNRDTLHRMLQFIYSDQLDKDMNWSQASSLYAAADFYALELLKQGCSKVLQESLSNKNVLGVLSVADLYQDLHLKSAALDFIFLNDHDIVGSTDWITFEKENGNLALETFRELYRRK